MQLVVHHRHRPRCSAPPTSPSSLSTTSHSHAVLALHPRFNVVFLLIVLVSVLIIFVLIFSGSIQDATVRIGPLLLAPLLLRLLLEVVRETEVLGPHLHLDRLCDARTLLPETLAAPPPHTLQQLGPNPVLGCERAVLAAAVVAPVAVLLPPSRPRAPQTSSGRAPVVAHALAALVAVSLRRCPQSTVLT